MIWRRREKPLPSLIQCDPVVRRQDYLRSRAVDRCTSKKPGQCKGLSCMGNCCRRTMLQNKAMNNTSSHEDLKVFSRRVPIIALSQNPTVVLIDHIHKYLKVRTEYHLA